MSCKFGEIIKKPKAVGKMSQTKPPPWRHTTAGERLWRVFSADLPRDGVRSARIICRFFSPLRMAKTGERAGWSAVWSSSLTGRREIRPIQTEDGQWCAALTGEAGQASAYLYSEARLYKGARLAGLSKSATTRSTGNISVWIKKVGHSNTHVEQWVLCFFPLKLTAALSLHFQHLNED